MLFAVLEFENDGILKHAEMKRVFDFFVRIFCPPKNRNKTVCLRNKIETQFYYVPPKTVTKLNTPRGYVTKLNFTLLRNKTKHPHGYVTKLNFTLLRNKTKHPKWLRNKTELYVVTSQN
jgi:hypothetical protein